MFFKTEDLVSSAKRSEFFPISQSTFTDPDDLIAFANEEMQTKLVPLVLSEREDYFLTFIDVTPSNKVNHYPMPERAIGNALKDIFWLPNSTTPDVRYALPKAQVHDAHSWSTTASTPGGFYLQGDEVVLVPTPGSLSGTERIRYYYLMRPNRLVPTSYCAKITGSSVSGSQITFTVDTDLTASALPQAVGSKLDFIRGVSPFRAPVIDSACQALTITSITVNLSDVQDEGGNTIPQVGDYICPAQTTCIPMIPSEFHSILSEMVCYRAMKALGATPRLQVVAQNIQDMLKGAMKMMSNRVEAEVDVVFDSTGFLASVGNFGAGWMVR